MQRNRGGGGQGLLGNAPVGFGNQSSAFSNNQSSAFSSGGFGSNLPSFGNNNTNGGSGGGLPNRFGDHRNENNAPNSDFSSNLKNPRADFFASGNNMGSSGKFNNSSSNNSFNGSFSSNNYNSINSSSGGGYSNSSSNYNSSNHNQPQQQQRNNMQGVGGMPPLHQLQQRQQQQQQQQPNRAPLGFGSGNNGQTLNSTQQQMNQLFNTDRDSQLALVNSLLKGSLIPNNANALNLQQQQNQKMQPPHSPIDNMQGMGGMNHMNSMGMNQQGMNQQRMSGNGMNGNGMNMGMNSIQGGGNHGNGGNGVTMGNHLGQGQFVGMGTGVNSGGTGNMGMTSPGGGHSILGLPKGHQGLIGSSQGGLLGNSQGLLGNQHSLLGNPSLPRNPDFMHRNSGGLLGRSNNNNRVNNGPRGGNHGYNPNNRPNNRSIQQHNRGRPERRNNNTDQHRRHDSRDSRDSHDSRDGRSRHGHDRRDNSIKRDESRNEYSEKRQVALPPSGGCESLRVSVGDGQEEYDPAEPTEDNAESNATSESTLLIEADRDRDLGSPEVTVIYHGGQKRPRSHSPVSRPHTTSGDLKVTVDAQGRSVQDGPPQPKTRRESSGSDVKDADDQKFTCYACSVDCKDIQHFESHMRSARHRTRMESICNLHVQKTDQQLARMRAEEHLRRIEGREKEDYCRICDKRFVGSFITHRRGQEHRRKERLTKRGCKLCRTGSFVQYCEYVKHIDSEPHKKQKKMAERPKCSLCRMSFHSPKAFVAHCKTQGHKQNKEVLRKQEQTSSHGRDDDDDDIESFPDSFEELVTLDATGIYKNDENDEVISDNDNDSIIEEGFSTTTNKKERIKSDSTNNKLSVQTLVMLQSEQLEAEDDEENTKPVIVNVKKDEYPAAENVPAIVRLHTQEEVNQQNVLSLPEFDSKVAVGQDHIVSMEGFFCKLCKKFYMSENAARSQHCRTRAHFDMYITYQKALHSKKAELENSVEQQINPCQNSNIEDDTPMPEEDDAPIPEAAAEAPESSILNNSNDMGLEDENEANDFRDLSEQNENEDQDNTQEDHEIYEQEEATENSAEPSSPTNVTVINGDIFTIQPVVNGNETATLENGSQEEQENGIEQEEEMEPAVAKKSLRVRRGRSRRGRAK